MPGRRLFGNSHRFVLASCSVTLRDMLRDAEATMPKIVLKLDMLAICAAFFFVGAVALGWF